MAVCAAHLAAAHLADQVVESNAFPRQARDGSALRAEMVELEYDEVGFAAVLATGAL